jgi:hypothetical protein
VATDQLLGRPTAGQRVVVGDVSNETVFIDDDGDRLQCSDCGFKGVDPGAERVQLGVQVGLMF